MNSTAIADTIPTLSPRAMRDIHSKAQARVADILCSTMTVSELDAWLRHYTTQRQEAIEENDVSAAVWAEYVLAGLEKALAQ